MGELTARDLQALTWGRLKEALRQVKRALVQLREFPRRRSMSLERVQQLAPVFVIGGNRSGTSIVSSVLSQHPELEGLFIGSRDLRYDAGGHAQAFCRSQHVWEPLSRSEIRFTLGRNRELPFWSLPHYVSGFYRRAARGPRERRALAWAVERLRKTDKPPLINDHYNMFRIGLIMDVFPRARFVLTTRTWRNFLEVGLHKWAHDGMATRLSATRPAAGLHWHLVNLIARYDLETFAPGRYAEVWLDTLHEGPDAARAAFHKALERLSLAPCAFDLRLLEPYWAKRSDGDGAAEAVRDEFALIPQIVRFERELLQAMGKP